MATVHVTVVRRVALALAIVTLTGTPGRAQQEPGAGILSATDESRSVLNQQWTPIAESDTATVPLELSDNQSWDPPMESDPATCVVGAETHAQHVQDQCGHGGTAPCATCGLNDQPGLIQALAARKHARWTLRSEALLLWRNAPPSRPIYSTIDPETGGLGPTALNANDLNSDVLAAPRLSFLRTDCDGRTLEATYLYAGNFYSDRTLPFSPDGYATSPPGIYGNTWGPPDTNLDSSTAKLLGQLQSLEFNTRHCLWADTCQFLIGARWLQWNESLQMQDSFSNDVPFPVTGNDFYQTQCFNNLWGGQIGLDTLLLGRVGQTRVEGLVKAGAYYNAAGQKSSYTYSTVPPFTFSASNRDTGPASAAFVGEVGMTAVIPISCNWDFRCGYFGLWLTGLAQPTQQLSHQTITQIDPPSGVLDTTGTLVLQGLSLGLEGRW
jgi:hypothetical protein